MTKLLLTMLSRSVRYIFNANTAPRRFPASYQGVRHYTKHACEGRGIRRMFGPFWVYTTPGFLQSFTIIGFFFYLFMYPLDSKLYNVRGVKAELDAKVGS